MPPLRSVSRPAGRVRGPLVWAAVTAGSAMALNVLALADILFANVLATAAVAATAATIALMLWAAWRDHRERCRSEIMIEAYDATHAGYLITGPEGKVLHATFAASRLLGMAGIDSLAVVETALAGDPEALLRFQRLRQEAQDGSPFSGELRVRRADGRADWWLVSARPLANRPGYIQWRVEDITTRHEMESILREEQVKLVDFMDHAPVGFYSVDQDGRFLFANATLAEWLGVEARELVRGDHHLHDFLVAPPKHGPAYALVADGAELPVVDVVMAGRDGRTLQASIAQTVVHAEDGRSVWTRSVVRDLAPERQMREALRASQDRFKRFFEDAPIGIALLDRTLALTEWNRAFQELIGTGPVGLAGRAIGDLLADRDRETVCRRLREVLEGAESGGALETQMQGKSGLVVALFANRLEGGLDAPPGLILQFIDQTGQKNLEAQFAQSQKMQAVGQLAGGIAHDFNNLLTAMIGFCDLLLLRHKPGDPSFGDIMQIKQNANRAANLVRQLLAFSRQQTLQPRILNITDVLAELSNLLRRLIGENIELKMVHGRDLGLVKVDQGQLEQVIINMAVNARDAMHHGGRLTIQTANVITEAPMRRGSDEMPPGNYVAIEVIDTGVGIPPENLDRIFDPFFSTKEIGSGTGLGLSTVYGIVRQTGGYVFVDSAVGQGARFAIYLPRYEEEPAAEVPAAEMSEPLARDLTGAGRILLVEDEDAVRVFSARALRNKGYEVLEAESGEVAITLLADGDRAVDLLITDVVMPKMDGPTLIRKVREIRPEMKVICISGYAEDRFRQHLDGGDVIHFLPKPFSLKQLAAKVKDVLRNAE